MKQFARLLDDGKEALYSVGAEHADARFPEIGDALEDRRSSQMSAYMQYATILAYALDRLGGLLLEHIYLVIKAVGSLWVNYLMEYPGTAKGGPAYHHSIHPIAVKGLLSLLSRCDVAVAYDWDVHVRMVLDLPYKCPVGLTSVHLGTGTPCLLYTSDAADE